MAATKKPAHAELEKLRQAVADAKVAARGLQDQEAAALKAVREADEALVRAIGTAGEAKATKALRAAEDVAREPWPQRREAARRKVADAEAVVTTYIASKFNALGEELAAEGDAASAELLAAIDTVVVAQRAWEDVSTRYGQLAVIADRRNIRGGQIPGVLTEFERATRQWRRERSVPNPTRPNTSGVIGTAA